MLDLADALLQAIRSDPNADAPKLIYADWLEEQGDPHCAAWRWLVAKRRRPFDRVKRPTWERYKFGWTFDEQNLFDARWVLPYALLGCGRGGRITAVDLQDDRIYQTAGAAYEDAAHRFVSAKALGWKPC